MYRVPIYKVSLVRDGSIRAGSETPESVDRKSGRSISSSRDAAALVREYLRDADREHFVVIMLDTKGRPIGINTVSTGTLNASLVHPREVFKPAILCNSAAIILAHNHPSGDPTPSREDRESTKRLVEAGELLGINVLDHVIIGDEGKHISFAEAGYLQVTKNSLDARTSP
ncbi:MAG: DNA repair protein RadC [bacterium]|nr:DNA repair protein RadC [bacterium]MDZ4346785.1 DNA repair protein RadC [Candidatus Binatia bacterium]